MINRMSLQRIKIFNKIQIIKPDFIFKTLFSSKKLLELLFKMPKEHTHTVELKSQRIKGKKKSLKYTPGHVSLQVLGSGAKGAPRSLYVFSDHSRYLFNCGEGTQRLAHEHKMKLSKLEHIFVTYSSWENIGGLPGVALTIQDVGVPEITLHGPAGVDEIFSATRRFVILKNMEVNHRECTRGRHFEDNVLSVKYVPLVSSKRRPAEKPTDLKSTSDSFRPTEKAGSSEDETDYYAHEPNRHQMLGKRKRSLSNSDNKSPKVDDVAMSYVCRLQPRPGALCLEKCVEKGVPPGPLLGLLKSGQDIVLDDGTVVRSSDVTLPDDPGPVFIVIEVPSEDFLTALENENDFSMHQESANKNEDYAYMVVHFTPPSVMTHPIYKNFMAKFPVSTLHLILNDDNICLGSSAVHRIQYKLNVLDDKLFSLLADSSIPRSEENNVSNEESHTNGDTYLQDLLKKDFCIINGKTLWKAQLRPTKILDRIGMGVTMNPEEFLNELNIIDGFKEELDKLKGMLTSFPEPIGEYPNIIFFGTGSCIPNKTRNTSAILVNMSDECSMILDCGEGTWGQLYRYFGEEEAVRVLSKLKAIYVSHLHADHHIGLIGLLKARTYYDIASPVYLAAPHQIQTWLNLYNRHFEPILQGLHLVPNLHLLQMEYNETDDVKGLKETLGLHKLETCRVIHCPNSFGVGISHKSGWKITYSGDTMPCKALVQLGHGSDILIHEATMEDELEGEAKEKLHSTTSQAIEAGQMMQAKYTMLTHFSQRYAKLPRINESFNNSNIGIAFDNMKVRLGDLPKLPLLYSILKCMFQDEYEELEIKATKRQMKLERIQKIQAS